MMFLGSEAILIYHIAFCSIMVGVIWLIQLVHYPAFHFIEKSKYVLFQKFHMERISVIVIPAMSLELLSGVLIFIYRPKGIDYFLISMIILFTIWVITAAYFARSHQTLLNGYNKRKVVSLVKMNWIRTFLWTLRLVILMIGLN